MEYTEMTKPIPAPYKWAGGITKFEELTEVFYTNVLKDPILEPVFGQIPPEPARHVAHFMAEVLKGPKFYSGKYGMDALSHMVGKHIGRKLTEQQRKQRVALLMESADWIGIPDDPEFRSTFVAHIELGTRVAVINSQLEENPTTVAEHIPEWGWGEVKGPYEVVGSLFQQKPWDPWEDWFFLCPCP